MDQTPPASKRVKIEAESAIEEGGPPVTAVPTASTCSVDFLHYENEAIDTSVYTLKHPITTTVGADLLLRTPDNLLIPVHQKVMKTKIPYFSAALKEGGCWREVERIGDTKVVDTPEFIPGEAVLTYLQFKYSAFHTKDQKNPEFSSNNIFDLIRLSSYWNDDEIKGEAINFLNQSMNSVLCTSLIARLFKEGFNDPALEQVLQTYMSSLATEKPNCNVCFKADNDPVIFVSIINYHPNCVKFLAQNNKNMVNKLFHELSDESQIRFMEEFYECSQQREINKPRNTPAQFIEKYMISLDAFPYYTPLNLALKIKSCEGGSLVKILLDNGAQAGYWNPTRKCSTLDLAVAYFTKEAKNQLVDDKKLIPPTTNIEQLLDHHAVTTSPPILARFEELRLSHPNAFKAVNDLLNKSVSINGVHRVYNHQSNVRADEHQAKIKERFQITKDIFFKSLKQANK